MSMGKRKSKGGCRCCGGDLHVLGELGSLLWLVCRHCGAQFSRRAK